MNMVVMKNKIIIIILRGFKTFQAQGHPEELDFLQTSSLSFLGKGQAIESESIFFFFLFFK